MFLYMYSALTRYWRGMMVNYRHYMLNEYDMCILDKTMAVLGYQMKNTMGYHYLVTISKVSTNLHTVHCLHDTKFENGMKLLCIV